VTPKLFYFQFRKNLRPHVVRKLLIVIKSVANVGGRLSESAGLICRDIFTAKGLHVKAEKLSDRAVNTPLL
jgi:hypothetical protein